MEKTSNLAVRALYVSLSKDVKSLKHSGQRSVCVTIKRDSTWFNPDEPPFEIDLVQSISNLISEWGIFIDNLVRTRKDYIIPMIILPDICKMFDKCLSGEKWSDDLFHQILTAKTNIRRKSSLSFELRDCLFGLIELTHDTGHILDASLIQMMRTFLNMFKKAKMDCPSSTIERTVHDFVEIERELREPSGTWSSDHWIPCRFTFSGESVCKHSHQRSGRLWKTVDDVFASIVPMSEVNYLHVRPKHGPGAVADVKTGQDKYQFPFWPQKLEATFPWCAFAQHREDLHISDDLHLGLSQKEPPARLIAVPKTLKGPRLIASEPTAHQFLQQGLLRWLRDHLTPPIRISYDPTSQDPSKDAALLASKLGSIATVDLSSASDRLSCWVVERAFRGNQSLLGALHAVRTRCVVDATGTDENLSIKLKKFANQGSAVTFPVQTIVYAGFCYAAILFDENLPVTRRNLMRVARKVRVYGDDIILPRSSVPTLSILLQTSQLKINVNKTHIGGSFRESCGMDAWRGHDVTPLYMSSFGRGTSPESLVSWVDVSNNAHRMGLWHLASAMIEELPKKLRKLIFTCGDDGDGLRHFTFSKGFLTQGKFRWNSKLHLKERRMIVLRSTSNVKCRESWQDLYQYLIDSPDPQSKWIAGYLTKNSVELRTEWVPIE